MLRLSKLADYGIIVMTYLGRDRRATRTTAEIALATGIKTPTCAKLLKALTRAGLVASQRGAYGGYGLALDTGAITVADIIRAIEGGPFGLTECSTTPGACAQESWCAVRTNFQRINGAIRSALEGVTLTEMLVTTPVRVPVPVPTSMKSTTFFAS